MPRAEPHAIGKRSFRVAFKAFSECAHFQRIISLAFYSRWNGYSKSHRVEIRKKNRMSPVHNVSHMNIFRARNMNLGSAPYVTESTTTDYKPIYPIGKRNSVGINLDSRLPKNMPCQGQSSNKEKWVLDNWENMILRLTQSNINLHR